MQDNRRREGSNGLKFINPYQFVRLGSEVERSEPVNGTLTGRIRISLIVKTPLAIPDAEDCTKDDKGHKTFSFFRVDSEPVIPGSQLRGMLRNAYETVSNSCFSVNNNNILSARHTNPANPGLVLYKNGAWHLYEARISKDYCEKINSSTDARRSWYRFRGDSVNKIIFHSTGTEIQCENLEQAIANYGKNIEIYEANGGKFKKFKPRLTCVIRKDQELHPVFYEIVEYEGKNYVYLSPSQMGRYVFDNRLDDLLDSHIYCAKHDNGNLCKACTLFGMIAGTGRKSYASKLRFSDAKASDFTSMGMVTLKELARPKPTAVEFYTQRPDGAIYWTYDYKITSYSRMETGMDKNGRKQSQNVPQKEKCHVVIRGRKFYLHNPCLKPFDYQTGEKTQRNSTMELCKPGSRFSFDLYFEKITEKQLWELLWTITIGENREDGVLMYKLGHGKPLGLGSVKLVVDELVIRSFDEKCLQYQIAHIDQEQVNDWISENPFDSVSESFKDFMRLSRFDRKPETKICYPIADDGKDKKNSKASHQWFISNRLMGENGSPTSWSVKYTLPEADSPNWTLPAIIKRSRRQRT